MFNDILWRWGRKRASILTLVFLGLAHMEGLRDPSNNGGLTDCCTQYEFSYGFGHYTDQNTPFKR